MFPVGDCAVGKVPPPGEQQAGQGSHLLNIYFIQSHQRELEPPGTWSEPAYGLMGECGQSPFS